LKHDLDDKVVSVFVRCHFKEIYPSRYSKMANTFLDLAWRSHKFKIVDEEPAIHYGEDDKTS
jgi:hypothetical protein